MKTTCISFFVQLMRIFFINTYFLDTKIFSVLSKLFSPSTYVGNPIHFEPPPHPCPIKAFFMTYHIIISNVNIKFLVDFREWPSSINCCILFNFWFNLLVLCGNLNKWLLMIVFHKNTFYNAQKPLFTLTSIGSIEYFFRKPLKEAFWSILLASYKINIFLM